MKLFLTFILLVLNIYANDNIHSNYFSNYKQIDIYLNNLLNNKKKCIKKEKYYYCKDNNITINTTKIKKLKLVFFKNKDKQIDIKLLNINNLKTKDFSIEKIKISTYLNKKNFIFENFNNKVLNFDIVQGYIDFSKNSFFFLETLNKNNLNKPIMKLKIHFMILKDDFIINNLYFLFNLPKDKKNEELKQNSFIKIIKNYYHIDIYNNNKIEFYVINKNDRSYLNFINFMVNLSLPKKEKINTTNEILKQFKLRKR